MHKRLLPKTNSFTYGVYYLVLPITHIYEKIVTNYLAINKFSFLSFHEKDHGNHKGNIDTWIKDIIKQYGINHLINDIILIAMPRVLGYVFNPISLWLCFDKDKQLRAVLCEVNNTFGENHSYLCAHHNGDIIKSNDWLKAEKLFHVSPFLKREGHYKFRFSIHENTLGVWIDFYNITGEKQIITSLIGRLQPLTKSSLRKAWLRHPLVTLKTIFLIHWQALKIISKGIKYISKPQQKEIKLSASHHIEKINVDVE